MNTLAFSSDASQELTGLIKQHVQRLAGDIGERNMKNLAALEEAAVYITSYWEKSGFSVQIQEFKAFGKSLKNLQIEILGQTKPQEIIVVGAHYDSVFGSPGANDNGTGIAAILEIARLLKDKRLERTIRFVAFVNEEPPFFKTSFMGSRVSARRSRANKENIIAMYSIETIGYYTDKKGSQKYPFPLNFFYPSVGNFIGFVSNFSSRKLLKKSEKIFRKHSSFPLESAIAPGWITGVDWSDHWSFWKEGYPAVMITDTALFRYRYYHTHNDTPDKIHYEKTTQVILGLANMIQELANSN